MGDTSTTTGPQRYRVIRAEIEALQWTGVNDEEMEAFAGAAFSSYEGEASLLGNPGGAWHPLDVGNYAVKGVTGEFFIIFGEDFADNYEPIEVGSSGAVTREPSDEWQAVLYVSGGWLRQLPDLDEYDSLPTISIVRRTAAPDDDRMSGTYQSEDVAHEFSDFDDEQDVVTRWAQAQAMAAGLNAAEATR